MKQSLLRRLHVGLLALPDFQSRLLDGAGKRKCQRPRQSRLESKIHGIQTGRGQFSGLAAGQKCNPRNGSGNGSQETFHRGVGHLVHGFLRGTGQSRQHHVGFENHAFQHHALGIELDENSSQDFLRHLAAPLQSMIAVHEHFRLDDGNQSGFLAQRGVAGQRVRVGLDATPAGNAIADGNHRPPLGKTRAHLKVFLRDGRAIRPDLR